MIEHDRERFTEEEVSEMKEVMDGIGNHLAPNVANWVWDTHKGDIPEGKQIDHIDGNTSNNSIDNLQLLTPRQNMTKYIKEAHPDTVRGRRDELIGS